MKLSANKKSSHSRYETGRSAHRAKSSSKQTTKSSRLKKLSPTNIAKRLRSGADQDSASTPQKLEKITNETVAEHREQILAKARRFKYPVQVPRRKIVINTLLVALIAVILLVIVAWQQLYIAQSSNNLLYRMTQIFPVPVASIDGELVRYSDYLVQYRGSRYYLGRYDEIRLDSADGRAQIDHIKRESLDRALIDTYASKLARQHNITVTEKDIDMVIEQQRNTANGKISQETYDASSRMMYNWSPADYRQAVRRSIIRTRVAFAIDSTASDYQANATMSVEQTDGDFAKVAAKLGGSGNSKPQVGDSGLVSKSSSYNGLSVADISKLETGKRMGPIKSSTDKGYYFIKVSQKTEDKVRFTYLFIPLTELNRQVNQLKADGKIQEFINVPHQ